MINIFKKDRPVSLILKPASQSYSWEFKRYFEKEHKSDSVEDMLVNAGLNECMDVWKYHDELKDYFNLTEWEYEIYKNQRDYELQQEMAPYDSIYDYE